MNQCKMKKKWTTETPEIQKTRETMTATTIKTTIMQQTRKTMATETIMVIIMPLHMQQKLTTTLQPHECKRKIKGLKWITSKS